MKRAVIFGMSDFAQVALPYLQEDGGYAIEAFTVHRRLITQPELLGLPVVPFEDLIQSYPPANYDLFIGVGYSNVNANRKAVYEECKKRGYSLPSYVHSSACVWRQAGIGEACFIFENCVVQPYARIGSNCIMWSSSVVCHHSEIGNTVFIASNAVVNGRCAIGDNCFIGANATIRDGIEIPANCVVGAGAVVLKDGTENGVYKVQSTPLDERRSDQLHRI